MWLQSRPSAEKVTFETELSNLQQDNQPIYLIRNRLFTLETPQPIQSKDEVHPSRPPRPRRTGSNGESIPIRMRKLKAKKSSWRTWTIWPNVAAGRNQREEEPKMENGRPVLRKKFSPYKLKTW